MFLEPYTQNSCRSGEILRRKQLCFLLGLCHAYNSCNELPHWWCSESRVKSPLLTMLVLKEILMMVCLSCRTKASLLACSNYSPLMCRNLPDSFPMWVYMFVHTFRGMDKLTPAGIKKHAVQLCDSQPFNFLQNFISYSVHWLRFVCPVCSSVLWNKDL